MRSVLIRKRSSSGMKAASLGLGWENCVVTIEGFGWLCHGAKLRRCGWIAGHFTSQNEVRNRIKITRKLQDHGSQLLYTHACYLRRKMEGVKRGFLATAITGGMPRAWCCGRMNKGCGLSVGLAWSLNSPSVPGSSREKRRLKETRLNRPFISETMPL